MLAYRAGDEVPAEEAIGIEGALCIKEAEPAEDKMAGPEEDKGGLRWEPQAKRQRTTVKRTR